MKYYAFIRSNKCLSLAIDDIITCDTDIDLIGKEKSSVTFWQQITKEQYENYLIRLL